jgi:hypothetical protein
MMFFPNSATQDGTWLYANIITSILSIAISMYLVLRLDRVDIRNQMA